MKKKSLKNLSFKKSTISKFEFHSIYGGSQANQAALLQQTGGYSTCEECYE